MPNPRIDARMPTMSASPSTDPAICRGLAPMARSRASSLHPLADHDRERVADQEGRHEQGDAGEAEQHVAERVDDRAQPGLAVGHHGGGRARPRRRPAGSPAIDCCTSST